MRFLIACLALARLCAQSDADALLAGIREKMRANLARLPDYTCRLTIDRAAGSENSRHLRPIDTVHIEVGYVAGKELYAWPGQKFANKGLDEMMPAGGAVGTGDFALHVRSIFLTAGPTFTFNGRSQHEGHEVIQFQFRVPRQKSRYLLRTGPDREDVVGYHGSFQADARTLLLERLEIALDEIPLALHVSRGGSILNYAVINIGGADFLLPHSSEMFLVDDRGNESRNRTRFERCRQYLGESVVSFAEPSAAAESQQPVTEVHLPAGILLDMILKTPVDARAIIGDPLLAIVAHDAVRSGAVVVPKGASVTARITRVGERNAGRVLYQILGLRLESVEFPGHRAELVGSLESLGLAATQATVAEQDSRRRTGSQTRGESILLIKGNSLHIPSGAHMYWRTLSDGSE